MSCGKRQSAAVGKTVHFLNAAFAETVGSDQFGLSLFHERGGNHFGGRSGVTVDQDNDRQAETVIVFGVVVFDRAVASFDRSDDAPVDKQCGHVNGGPSAGRRDCRAGRG